MTKKRPPAYTEPVDKPGVTLKTEFCDDGTRWITEYHNGKAVKAYRVDPNEPRPWWKWW